VATRVSHEALILAKLREALAGLPGVTYATGMGAGNRFPLDGWRLVGSQQFQFGDLRIETATATIVVEAESGGGVTNLAKYWPYLEARPKKRFVLAHLFQVLSANDYVSHMRLWEYLVERMRADLEARVGVRWPEHWEARAFRYGPQIDAVAEVAAFLRAAAS
jgi:DNA-binding response OmpR family regulator